MRAKINVPRENQPKDITTESTDAMREFDQTLARDVITTPQR